MTDYNVIIIILIVALIIALFIFSAKNKRSDVRRKKTDVTGEKRTSKEKKDPTEGRTSKVIISDDFQTDKIFSIKEQEHVVTKLLVYREKGSTWICPCCETENPLSSLACCLCYYERKQ